MNQYLITTFTDSTGQTFTEATKARDNQTFTVVEAEFKKQAIKTYDLHIQNKQVGKPKARYDFKRNQYFFRDKNGHAIMIDKDIVEDCVNSVIGYEEWQMDVLYSDVQMEVQQHNYIEVDE
ncbi:DUF1381 domain-containing protein [Staphylococcus pseudintermedius]|uniref:DUF1381 domain-containing protein n=1 Tax=Staphylococcus pseudintermedius TaxID=283734 RepID=UPI000C711A38|nr:DUF1381 domain-containing protein [Staphylococcus pseudintermedius]PPD61410.1 DUF1381 domain-containing protein [Staphylococcus pseudintermedius]